MSTSHELICRDRRSHGTCQQMNSANQGRWPGLISAIASVVCLLASSSLCEARIDLNTELVKSSLVFLYSSDAAGKVPVNPIGTGFFLTVPRISNPNRGSLLLVTARHIVDPAWLGCDLTNPVRLFARLNKKKFDPLKAETGVDYILLDLQPTNAESRFIHVHPDPAVDIAVMQISGTIQNDFDINGIHFNVLANDEEIAMLWEGDPIVSAGLLPGRPGIRRNYPFFKFGHISNRLSEDVEASCPGVPRRTRPLRHWFVAAALVPGNSGSPGFYVKNTVAGVSLGGEMRPMLIGIQSVGIPDSDVAGMVPVQYLYEIVRDMKIPDADLSRGTK